MSALSTPRHPTLALRFAILRRDDFRCQYCGATALEDKLEVDHIIPWEKGGETVASNLTTSCRRCNAGKKNTTIVFRPSPEESAFASTVRNRILDRFGPFSLAECEELRLIALSAARRAPDPKSLIAAIDAAEYYQETINAISAHPNGQLS
jgi:hypothetical protein